MADLVKIGGLSELDRALKEFSARVEGNILRAGLRAGVNVFRDRARAAVPQDSGALRKSIRVSTRSKRGRVSATLIAGNAEAFYAHMVEFGTASFYTGTGKSVGGPYLIAARDDDGKLLASRHLRQASKAKGAQALYWNGILREQVTHPGVRPQPFMRPAFDGGQQAAVEAMANHIRSRLAKEMAKR